MARLGDCAIPGEGHGHGQGGFPVAWAGWSQRNPSGISKGAYLTASDIVRSIRGELSAGRVSISPETLAAAEAVLLSVTTGYPPRCWSVDEYGGLYLTWDAANDSRLSVEVDGHGDLSWTVSESARTFHADIAPVTEGATPWATDFTDEEQACMLTIGEDDHSHVLVILDDYADDGHVSPHVFRNMEAGRSWAAARAGEVLEGQPEELRRALDEVAATYHTPDGCDVVLVEEYHRLEFLWLPIQGVGTIVQCRQGGE